MTLDGVDTYTGLTDVEGGTLVVGDPTHTGASIAGSARVEAGALLDIKDDVSGTASLTIEAAGTLELEGNDTRPITFAAAGATLALDHPNASNSELLQNLVPGDVLELPGTSVSSVSFGANSLTVTTNDGSFAFTNVTYATPVTGYSAAFDAATGLEAITLTALTTFRWINTAGGDWHTSGDWSSDIVPGAADDAFISMAGAAPYIVAVSDAESAHDLTLNATNAELHVSTGGTLDIGGAFSIDAGTAGVSSVTVASGAVLDAGSVSIGNSSGSNGMVTVNAGGRASVAGAIDLGALAGSSGALVVSGAGAGVTATGALTVGDAGSGSLTVRDGGVVSSASGDVGTTGDFGTVGLDGAGSQWLMSGRLRIGVIADSTGPSVTISNDASLTTSSDQSNFDELFSGSLTLTSGGQLHETSLEMRYDATLSLSSGAALFETGIDTSDADTNVAANGTITIDDATLSSPQGGINIGIVTTLGAGTGTATASNGSQITSAFVDLGFDAGDSGSLTLTGATTVWSDVLPVGGPSDSGTSFIGSNGSGTLLIEAGAALHDATAAQLGVFGGGVGTATVAGTGSSWTVAGPMIVGNGGTATLTVSAGGLVSAASMLIGNASGSHGTVTVDAGSSAAVAGAIDLGALAGSSGTLVVSGIGASVTAADLDVGGSLTAAGGSGTVTIGIGGLVTVTNDAVWAGGQIDLTGGMLMTDPITVASGGSIIGFGVVTGALTNDGLVTASGGLLDLTGDIDGTGTIVVAAGARLRLDGSVGAGQTIDLQGTSDTLDLTNPPASTIPTGEIDGFVAGDAIDLADVSFDPSGTATLGANNQLQVVEHGTTYDLKFGPGDFAGASFHLAADGAGTGTAITEVPLSGQTFTLTTGVDHVEGGAGNNTVIAAANTLTLGDTIDGGTGGTNTLALRGGGTFDLRAPTTLTDIEIITAQEGQPAGISNGTTIQSQVQTIYLRNGLNATVNVSPATLTAGNTKAPTIDIIGANNTDVINLASGNDIVTVGGTGETVHGGSGVDQIFVTSATIGATIDGGSSGRSTLVVTGGGTMAMGSNITDIASVSLSSSPTAYNFTANGINGLVVNDQSGGLDSMTAGGVNQTLTGGAAGHETMVSSAGGADTFKDTAALFNNDTIVGFAASNDVIDLTNVAFTGQTPGFAQGATSGVLSITDGTHSAAITLFGQFAAAGFQTASDGATGTDIIYHPTQQLAALHAPV